MYPGAEIVVNSNYNLSIIESQVNGCGDQLWKSITVQSNANLEIGESIIRDGREAVQALDQSKLWIYGSLFDRNYISVYVPSTLDGSNISSLFYQNTFSCTEDLLDNFESPQLGITSFAGVWMDNAEGLIIGHQNVPTNVNIFNGLRNGIVALRSVVKVHHVDMQDLAGGSLNLSSLSGVGVYTANCTDFRLSQSNFNGVYTGVFSQATNVNQLDGCVMGISGNVRYGIRIQPGFETINNITNNIIHCSHLGISISDLINAKLKVTGNNIYPGVGLNAAGQAGIAIYNSHFIDPNLVLFSQNEIELYETAKGIHVNYSSNLRINDNIITELAPVANNPKYYSGILLRAAKNCQVRDNYITGLGSISGITGMQISSSTGTIFCCNTIDATKRGVDFIGGCDDTNLRVTDVSTVQTIGQGLHLRATATIGVQISEDGTMLYGNIFSDGSVNSGATHEGMSIPDVHASEIFIDPVNHPETVPFPINAIPGSTWFPFSSQTTLTCALYSDCNIQGLLPPGGTDSRDIKTAEGGSNFGAYTNGLQWEASRYLYWKLKNYAALHYQNSSVDSFYSANQTTVLGDMYDIEQEILDLFQPDVVLWQGLTESLEKIEAVLPAIAFQDSLLMTTADTLHNPIQVVKDSLLQLLAGYHQNAVLLQDSIFQERALAVASVKSNNLSVSTSADYETNLQQINDIYLSTIALGINEFNSSQLTQIETIAGKCPLSDGNAVYFARGLLAMVKDTIFDDDAICDAGQGYRISGQGEEELNTVHLYPNPAYDQLTLEFEEAIEFEYEITFYSVTGQQYASYKLAEDQQSFTLDISTIPSGLYFYKIRRNEKNIASGKLTIMKL